MYYLLKIKGIAKIPDYIQLRDQNFTLIAYFRIDRPDKALQRSGLEKYSQKIINIAALIPYGKVEKIIIN